MPMENTDNIRALHSDHFIHNAKEPEKPEVDLKYDYTFGTCKKQIEKFIK